MRLNGLRAFRYVYEEGSISAAAKRQNLSQPAVSRLLSSLEEEIDIQLFYRNGRRLSPTPEGTRFYDQTNRLLASIDDLPRIAKTIREGSHLRVRLLAMRRLTSEVALPVLAQLHKKWSKAEVQVEIVARRELESRLDSLDYDLALTTLPIAGNVAHVEQVSVQEMYVVVRKDDPLAAAKVLEFGQVAGREIAALPLHTRLRQELEDMFRSFSITPRIAMTVSSVEAAIELVSLGVGITIADGMMLRHATNLGCVLIPLTPVRNVTYGIVRPPFDGRHQIVTQFEEMLRARFRKLSEDVQDSVSR